MTTKIGRNDPCPCGSGKKYKKCCFAREVAPVASLNWQKMRRTEGELIPVLLKHAVQSYGPEAVVEAWDEFTLWNELPMDPETQPELDTAFMPWFVFNWLPDNAEVDEENHYPELPVAIHYLQTKGSQLDSYHRRFIESICSQHYSFFVVTDVVPGKQLTLRDLFLQQEVTVHERQASAILSKGMILYSRTLTLDDSSIMVGCAPTAIPPNYINEFIDIREDMTKNLSNLDASFLFDYDIELREIYYDIRDELHNPVLPHLHNTDDDPLQLTKLTYRLACSPQEALDALATLSLVHDADELARDGTFNKQGELEAVEFGWLKKGNQQNARWENTVMGNIVIKKDQMTIEVNSQERADAIQRKITRRLGKRAVFRHAVIQSAEKMLEEMANKPRGGSMTSASAESEALQNNPEIQAHLQKMATQHWQAWLDTPLPALNNKTPREAAKSDAGRERLEALLWQFEQHSETPQPFSPDVSALRETLGLK